jgi:hypothetical protein
VTISEQIDRDWSILRGEECGIFLRDISFLLWQSFVYFVKKAFQYFLSAYLIVDAMRSITIACYYFIVWHSGFAQRFMRLRFQICRLVKYIQRLVPLPVSPFCLRLGPASACESCSYSLGTSHIPASGSAAADS